MDISVIVPIYNVEPWIETCMQSIIQQKFLGTYEVILVDDCGTDQSVSLAVEKLQKGNIEPVLLRHASNRGLSAARNTGMEVATGKYIFFVDSDDYISEDCLGRLFAKAEETKADVTVGGCKTSQGKVFDSSFITAWNKLYLRDFLQNNHIRFIEGLLHEDNPWSFEIACKTDKVVDIPDITYFYQVRDNSLQTDKDYTKHFNAYCQILIEYSRIIKEVKTTTNQEKLLFDFERQKALFYTMTLEQGTVLQQKYIYRVIRSLRPIPKVSKADFHYRIPECMGFYAYKKFHKCHLC